MKTKKNIENTRKSIDLKRKRRKTMNSNLPSLTQEQENWVYGKGKVITKNVIDESEKYIKPKEFIDKLDKFFEGGKNGK